MPEETSQYFRPPYDFLSGYLIYSQHVSWRHCHFGILLRILLGILLRILLRILEAFVGILLRFLQVSVVIL